jgi:hypothetical protein
MNLGNLGKVRGIIGAGTALALLSQGAAASPVSGALGESKPILEFRLRYEHVDQLGIVNMGNGLSARIRAGLQTGKAWNTALLVEAAWIDDLQDGHRVDNSIVGFNTAYPLIADPKLLILNRLQLTNTSIANTTITLGRQRINLDDQRFVGNVGWRQNEQTFDALRVVNTGIRKLTIDASYLRKVNRVFGRDSPQSPYAGRSWLLNAAYATPIGKLTGFGYLLDFDPIAVPTGAGVTAAQSTGLNPARVSTSTYGARLSGERPVGRIKVSYVASYAQQDERGANPLRIDNDYRLLELGATWRQFNLVLGDELLSGNGTIGFSTPLATLHKFQGWVDKFLTTPVNGIDDRYATFNWQKKGVGPFDTMTATASYHQYESDLGGVDYGTELNLLLAAKYQRFTGGLKYGDYQADSATPITLARDTRKFWAYLEFAY